MCLEQLQQQPPSQQDQSHPQITNILVGSSFLFLLPICYAYSLQIMHCILAVLLFINTICSVLFWSNPIRYSIIHKIDCIFARITFVFVVYYFLFYKNTTGIFHAFGIFLYILFTYDIFLLSDHYSSIEWCSEKHVYTHMIFHISTVIGIFLIFG